MFDSLFSFLFKYRPLVFRESDFVFAAPRSIVLFVVIALFFTIPAALSYVWMRGQTAPGRRAAMAAVRVGTLAVLAFCLVRPSLSVSSIIEQQGYVALLVDQSRSMSVRDESGKTRAEAVSSLLATSSPLRRDLETRFRVRTIPFGTDNSTDIGAAIERATGELSGLPLAGVVVISDGADNAQRAWSESLLPLRSARLPVFTVAVGKEGNDDDVRLSRVTMPASVLKGTTVIAEAEIQYHGAAGADVQVDVVDAGRLLARQTVTLPRGSEVTHTSLAFTANETGPRQLRVRVTPVRNEKQIQNNERDAVIEVRDRREKVLLVDGEPRFEDKFIRRALGDEKNVQVVQLLRTAPKKFLRLDVDSAGELPDGFPTSRADLYKYRALILANIEASQLTSEQLNMITDFVAVRGGGLLMLGGPHAFAEGGWAGTAVGDALPVKLQRSGNNTSFKMANVMPTVLGLGHPVTRIDSTEAASRDRWGKLPPLSTVNAVGELKPGATALLTSDSTGTILAAQRFGRGMVMSFTPQDSWLWQMHHDVAVDDMTHETFWRQLLRYLVQDASERNEIDVVATARTGEVITATIHERDSLFNEINTKDTTFTASQAGLHEITRDNARTFVLVTNDDVELYDPQSRPATLAHIAEETGGRHYTIKNAATLPEDISLLGHGATVHQLQDLWDMPALFIVLIGFLCAEWLYRRRRGTI